MALKCNCFRNKVIILNKDNTIYFKDNIILNKDNRDLGEVSEAIK